MHTRRILLTIVLLTAVALGGLQPVLADGTTTAHDESTLTTAENQTYPITLNDSTGANVTLEEPADEVVVLDYASAQIFWEINASDHVVGMPVGQYSAYLNGSENRTNVLDGETVLTERVINLTPDIVVAGSLIEEADTEALREAGIPVYVGETEQSFQSIYNNTRTYGTIVGQQATANRTVAEMHSTIERIETAVADREKPRVFYHLGGGYTAGSGTFIDDIITAAGGTNIAAEAGISGYQVISEETIAEYPPDWIIVTSETSVPRGPVYNETPAIEQNNVLLVNGNYLNQAGPRTVIPLEAMAAVFHPGAVDSEYGQILTVTPTDAQPGFGVAAGIVAISSLLFFRGIHRRD